MKNLFFLALIALTLASCKDTDQPDPTNNSSNIEGVWNFAKLEQTNGQILMDGVPVGSFTAISSNEQGTMEFKSDGTANTSVGYTSTFSFIIQGIPQTQTATIPLTTSTGTYTYNGSTKELTMTANGETTSATVTELTANKLVFTQYVERSQFQNGVTTTTKFNTITTLTK